LAATGGRNIKFTRRLLTVSFLTILLGGLGGFIRLPEVTLAQTSDPVFVGAGDIASCGTQQDEATANLLDSIPGTVFTLGDNVYQDGTLTEFNNCYAPSWGRHKSRTRPAPGNHDYHVPGAAGYFDYFGAAAGDRSKGYYSYDLGAWHILALNSEIEQSTGSAQEQWLRAELAAHPNVCTLAYWHKPRFSSGPHGDNTDSQALWQALYEYRADVVLNGHDHSYERFGLQNPSGQADLNGIREFVVGTGGNGLRSFPTIQPNSEKRNDTSWGVLKLTLHATSYDWQFIPIAGQTFTDVGSGNCVHAGPTTTFADVPVSHPYYNDIQLLYANGLTGGCSTSPLKFCPDQIMDRAQSAVFMMRGSFGASYSPPTNLQHKFKDDWTKGAWAEPWAEAMYNRGLTSGCSSSPLMYCPWYSLPREQLVIFGLKMKYGNDYLPPPATGTVFADLTDPSYYATSWAEQAYADGLLPACGVSGGKPKFCPKVLVTRGLGAYVIVRAKNLTMP